MHPDVFSKEWFDKHQSKLVWFANTKIGRLCLGLAFTSDARGQKIEKITPSSISYNKNDKQRAEFRTNNQFAIRMYRTFKPVWHLMHAWDMLIANNLNEQLNVGFDTFIPDRDPETDTCDGFVYRSSVDEDWSTIRGGSGTGNDSSVNNVEFGITASGTVSQYSRLSRGALIFDTSSIPSSATVNSATLKLHGNSKRKSLGKSDAVVTNFTSSSTNSLVDADFVEFEDTEFARISYDDWTTGFSGYAEAEFNNSGINAVSKTSLTKLITRIAFDAEDQAPTIWAAGGSTDYRFKSSEVAFFAPQLVVEYQEYTPDIQEIDRKQYIYKVYTKSGDYLGDWADVVSELGYTQEINSAGSAIEVELARNSDSIQTERYQWINESGDDLVTSEGDNIVFRQDSINNIGEGSDVDLNLNVDVYVFYGSIDYWVNENGDYIVNENGDRIVFATGAPKGRRIFSGYISRYQSRYGSEENTVVSIFSHGAELENYLVHDGDDTTVAYNSQDPSDIVKGVLDTYAADGGVVTYGENTVDDTNAVVSYTFRLNTVLEALDKSVQMAQAGGDWYYYLDMGSNEIVFKERSVEPNHVFTLGKEILSLNLEKYIEDLENVVYFTGGDTGGGENLFTMKQDSDSINTYRRGLVRLADSRVTLVSSANLLMDASLQNALPQFRSTVTVSDASYDIETIKPGDVIGFRNFGNFIDSVKMQVVSVDYSPDQVGLQLDTLSPSIPKRLADLKRNQIELENKETPDSAS